MDIQQYIYNNSGVLLPISGGNGQSQNQAVVIDSKAKYRLIQVENEFISAMLNEGYWKKVQQSLIFDDDRKYDKITIHNFLDNADVVQRVFWFDITECFL
jgi:outer membrane lipoprotein-sorting protein